jgi:hypothetical protein
MFFLSVQEWQEHHPLFLPDFSRGAPDRVETAVFADGTSPGSILLDGIFFSGLKHGKHFISGLRSELSDACASQPLIIHKSPPDAHYGISNPGTSLLF